MTTFDKREEAFELKFAHDEELRFKAHARRDKLLGLWAAEKMGLAGDAAAAYAASVVVADVAEPGAHDVVAKILADFANDKVEQSEHQVRRAMDEFMATAVAQIQTGV
jgi:hypothetical protein